MASLKQKTISALLWDFLGTFSTQGIGFIITILLARILSPEDFGLVGMALVFIGLSQVFMDAGFSKALIQRKENDDLTYSSVFLFNIVFGLILFVCFQLLAPYIAIFYKMDAMINIIRCLAFSIPVYALTVVQVSILNKELRFKELSVRMFVAGIISGTVGVVLAIYGYGVYALVIQYLLSNAIAAIILWNVSSWRPNLVFSLDRLNSLVHYSKYVFFSQVLAQTIAKLDTLVIGKFFSAATLGYFSRSESINQLVVKYSSSSINKVFFPIFSKLKDEKEQFRNLFLRVVSLVSAVTFLISGICIFSGEAIIIGLFGEKWRPSVFIFQILMLRIFNYPINAIIVNTFLAFGKAKEDFLHGLVRKALKVSTLVVAVCFGFEMFLYSIIVMSYMGTLYNNVIVSRLIKVDFFNQFSTIYRFALLFAIAVIPSWFVYDWMSNIYIKSLLSSLVFTISYVVMVLIFDKNLLPEINKLIGTTISLAKKKNKK